MSKLKLIVLLTLLQQVSHAQSPEQLLTQLQSQAKHQLDSAVLTGERCIAQSIQQGDQLTELWCRYYTAMSLYNLGQPWEAQRALEPTIEPARKVDDPRLLFAVLRMQHDLLTVTEEDDRAWQILQEMEAIARHSNDPRQQAELGLTKGYFVLYKNRQEKTAGIRLLEDALAGFRSVGDSLGVAKTMRRIAQFSDDPELAIAYLQASQSLYQQDEIEGGWIHFSIAMRYLEQTDYEMTLAHLDTAILLHQRQNMIGGLADHLLVMGDVLVQQKRYQVAIDTLHASLAYAEQIPLPPNIRDATALLAQAHAALNQHALAYQYLQRSTAYKDSTFNTILSKQIAESNARYENERLAKSVTERELDIERERGLRSRTLALMGGLLLLALAVFQWVYQRQKRKKAATEMALTIQQNEATRLRELNQFKTNFFTNIAHELRTPLTLILSPLRDAIGHSKAKPVRDKLQLVERNGQHLLSLVNEIMDLSKATGSQLELHPANIALAPTIHRIFGSFESAAQQKRLVYTLDNQATTEQLRIDLAKLEKILNNLLSNAIKYTQAKGTVTLTVATDNDTLSLTVADTGPGIHPSDQAYIFDRFYQARHRTHSLQGGTGIGLALVKELTEALGGTLQLNSVWQQGTQLSVQLPYAAPTAQLDHRSESAIAYPASEQLAKPPSYAPLIIDGAKPRILLVEDHPEMGKYLTEILSTHYACVWTHDGEAALNQLRRHSFAAIVSDVMMPNMDGFQLREALNEHPDWRRIPFVLLTARVLEQDKLRGFQLGIDDYVTKPFSTPELHARLHNLICNKLERDEYLSSLPSSAPIESADAQQLRQMEAHLLAHLEEEDYSVDNLAGALACSVRQLRRLVKSQTGLTPVQFILEFRLQQARRLLEQRQFVTVFEVQCAVGIRSTSYFTRKFTERFGENPMRILGKGKYGLS